MMPPNFPTEKQLVGGLIVVVALSMIAGGLIVVLLK
jgi:hypothetical protein